MALGLRVQSKMEASMNIPERDREREQCFKIIQAYVEQFFSGDDSSRAHLNVHCRTKNRR